MLNKINDLEPFYEDCTREVSVREYARISKVSPPSASKLLQQYKKEGLLVMREEYNRKLYSRVRSKLFIQLHRTYWLQKLSVLTQEIEQKLQFPLIILFGSLSKAENTAQSDIDIAIIYGKKKMSDIALLEKSMKRSIQIFQYKNEKGIPKNLTNAMRNGFTLSGMWKE